MAIVLRNQKQLTQLREAGKLVAETFTMLRPYVRPGVEALELDRLAEEFVRSRGAVPAYKGYRGFPSTLCISPNNVICHGFPRDYRLNEGDIVGIDMGVVLDGWYGDACVTLPVGAISAAAQRLLDVAEEGMWCGIRAARGGKQLGDIGAAIQQYVEANGFSVVREWTGHGVGQRLHEEPTVLHYGKPGSGLRLRPGMVFTVEPMINAGGYATILDQVDGWTVRTADGSLSAQFEHTIAVTDGEPEILTLPA
ncbi:MAG TPA: type I methionyl aminopeptidase [Roseiflexaceae bacterium]|nr:type I methionyl aminopeptidase [Roseiflexaceae bacterium]HMP38934.1 type I methionyl aminopeptidase [Roseiflexaceae bacterium]